jgi:HisA/HisF family protein
MKGPAVRLIPVIDLMGGLVVRGVGGRRGEYRPVESRIATSAEPAEVARAFHALGAREAYVADLDAIASGAPDVAAYRRIAAAGLSLWIDAGATGMERAEALLDAGAEGEQGGVAAIVAGLESLPGPQGLGVLAELTARFGGPRILFSLDLVGGRPKTAGPGWEGISPRQIADQAVARGVERMIVLDLARVGMRGGNDLAALCGGLHAAHPRVELIAGGGVRNLDDAAVLAAAGCRGVLVATALHDGTIGGREFALLESAGRVPGA